MLRYVEEGTDSRYNPSSACLQVIEPEDQTVIRCPSFHCYARAAPALPGDGRSDLVADAPGGDYAADCGCSQLDSHQHTAAAVANTSADGDLHTDARAVTDTVADHNSHSDTYPGH